MKKTSLIIFSLLLVSLGAIAQFKKDGTPDMRYKSNKEIYGGSYSTPSYSSPSYSSPSYSTPSYSSPSYSSPSYSTPDYYVPKQERNYSNGGEYRIQNGYMRSNGTYVTPHVKTSPDNSPYNNYKYKP